MIDTTKMINGTDIDLRIARYISENASKVIYMRVRDLAEATNVSAATIVRFTKKMGYESFAELKMTLKNETSPNRTIMKDDEKKQQLINHDVFPKEFDDKIDKIVQKLDQADFIHCLGLGTSGIMAEYAAKQLSNLGYRSFASTEVYTPYIQKEKLAYSENEIAIFFSVSGETPEIYYVIKELEDTPVYRIGITNQEKNRIAESVDLNLSYDVSYDRLYYNIDISSQLPVVYIIEKLVEKMYNLHS